MQSDHFPFVYCVENLTYEGEYANWETCFQKVNVDPKPVLDCYTSGFGHEVNFIDLLFNILFIEFMTHNFFYFIL